jgi:hypothetical protein
MLLLLFGALLKVTHRNPERLRVTAGGRVRHLMG